MSKKKKSVKTPATAAGAETTSDLTAPRQDTMAVLLGVGFGALFFLRTFFDGLVWPPHNVYFNWGIALLGALWAGWALMRDKPVRVGLSGWLLCAFVVFATLTLPYAISFDETLHALPLWASYAMAFIAVRNLCRDSAARNICLSFIGTAMVMECLFSFFHLWYILPESRRLLTSDPEAGLRFFGASEVTPDIAHRLESNRAFGSFMFPNALAGYVVLGIPWGVGGALSAWAMLRETLGKRTAGDRTELSSVPAALIYLILPCFTALVLYEVGLSLVETIGALELARETFVANAGFQSFVLYVVPLVVAFTPPFLVWRYGMAPAGNLLRCAVYPVLALLTAVTLWSTASRGAMLGTLVAFGLWGLIELGRKRGLTARFTPMTILAGLAIVVPMFLAHGQGEDVGLDLEGRNTSVSELANLSTMRLRLHYWSVGSDMAGDHLATGVGLNNFANAYPHYRYVGAPYVQMAHNDYLQMFAETGLIGGGLFLAFWAVVLWSGLVYVAKLPTTGERWVKAGLLFGVMAFALHQAVDFGFQNPSLALTVFCLAGIWCADADRLQVAAPTRGRWRSGILIGVLCVGALTAGATSRIYIAERGYESLGAIGELSGASLALLNSERDGSGTDQTATIIPASSIVALIDNSNELNSIGYFAEPTGAPDGSGQPQYRRIQTQPELKPGTVFIVENTAQARLVARAALQRWLNRAVEVDESYPHRWKLAFDIYQVYEILWNATPDLPERQDERYRISEDCLTWARTFHDRNPYNGFTYLAVGKALWYRGDYLNSSGDAAKAMATYDDAVAWLKEGTDYSRAEPELMRYYADYAFELSQRYAAAGQEGKSEHYYSVAKNTWIAYGELSWLQGRQAYYTDEQQRLWLQALLAWKKALQRETNEPKRWEAFGRRLDDYAGLVEYLGNTEAAAEYRKQAEGARERAKLVATGAFSKP